MNRDWYKTAIWLMWLALPFTLADYGLVWDQLPARMAIHFDANWHPNGWTSRDGAFLLAVGVVFVMLLVLSVVTYVMRRSPVPKVMPWAMLVFCYAVLIFVCAVNHWVVHYNLEPATPASPVQSTTDNFMKWSGFELHS
jgi:uncharacterized membrane protein